MAWDVPYCSRPEDFELFPDTARAVKLLNEHGFKVIVITNQSGIARGYFTEEVLAEIHEKMKAEIASEGAWLDGIYHCPHHPDEDCGCRKPRPELVLKATRDFDIDLGHSFVVGDLSMDIDLGKAVGCGTVLVKRPSNNTEETTIPDAIVADLLEAVDVILKWDEAKEN